MPAQLAAEARVQAEPAAQVHLEALDLVAVGVGDQLALEPDVGDLDPGAGVGAAVELIVSGRPGRDVGEPLLQLVDQRRWRGALVSTMASLQNSMPVQAIVPTAGTATGVTCRPSCSSSVTSASDFGLGDVEHDQLLLGGQPDPARPGPLGQLGDVDQRACRTTRPAIGATPT